MTDKKKILDEVDVYGEPPEPGTIDPIWGEVPDPYEEPKPMKPHNPLNSLKEDEAIKINQIPF